MTNRQINRPRYSVCSNRPLSRANAAVRRNKTETVVVCSSSIQLFCIHRSKALGAFAAMYAKTAESIEMPFEGLTQVGPWNPVLYGVKVGRIHSPLRGVIRRRCGVSSKFFDPLFNWPSVRELRHVGPCSRKRSDDNCINNHIVSK